MTERFPFARAGTAESLEDSLPSASARVGGYRVIRRLATGGTSDVLLAKAEGPHGFERTVVLKLLLSQFRDDDELARMFAREASAYARLAHPSIVRLFDFFAQEPTGPQDGHGPREGQLVMVLEYVDGPALGRLRSMLKIISKELDDRAAIYVAARIFDALAAAHSATDDAGSMAPVIHRDVNPSNVLVPWDGHVKLADFGVAKVTGLNHQSAAGMIKGTYGYMAPEQVTGETVTPRADVYAAGIILWELLTKRRAFQRGALPEIEALRAMAEPRLLALDNVRPDVHRSIRDAVKRALEPRPDKRTITAEEIVSVLTSVVPTDEGRERLVTALNAVKADARAMNVPMAGSGLESRPPPANIPPNTLLGSTAPAPPPMTMQGGAHAMQPPNPRGMLPKSAPRPASVPRFTAGYPATTPASPPAASPPPPLSAPEPPKRPSAQMRIGVPPLTGLPETKRNPHELQTQLAAASATAPAPAPTTGVTSAPMDAQTLVPSSDKVSLFDSLVEAPVPSDRDRDIKMKDILRGVPSSMPPSVLGSGSGSPVPERRPSSSRMRAGSTSAIPVPPPPRLNMTMPSGSPYEANQGEPMLPPYPPQKQPPGSASVAEDTSSTAKIGRFPGPAAPLKPLQTPATPMVSSAPTSMSGFGETVRELVAKSEAQTVVPPPSQVDREEAAGAPPPPPPPPQHRLGSTALLEASPATPRMTPIHAKQASTLAMQARPPMPPPAPGQVPTSDPVPQLFSAPPPPQQQQQQQQPQQQQQQQYPPPSPPQRSHPSLPAIMTAQDSGAAQQQQQQQHASLPVPSPVKSGPSVGLVIGILAVVAVVGIAVAIGFVRYQHGHTVTTTPTAPTLTASAPTASTSALASAASVAVEPPPPPPIASSVAAVPSTTPSSAPSATPSAVIAIAEGMGILKTTGAAAGRRIFVDDKTLGQTPETVTIACGQHNVKLGSSGKMQKIDVPCGGEIVVSDKF